MAHTERHVLSGQHGGAPTGGNIGGARGTTGHGANPIGTAAGGLPGPAPNTAGPHNNDMLNKLDPTVDSQSGGTQVLGPGINASAGGRTAGYNTAAGAPGAAHSSAHAGEGVGHSQYHSSYEHPQHGTHAPHEQRHAGFDATDARTAGVPGGHAAAPQGMAAGGAGGAGGFAAPQGSQPVHSSQLANTLDPRVSSNTNDSSRVPMQSQHTTTAHHGHTVQSGSHAAAPPGVAAGGAGGAVPTGAPQGSQPMHSSSLANTIDPRVDSNVNDGSHVAPHGQHTTTVHQGPTVQPGPASKTAGPHSSNILNKLDPMVNSKATISQEREYRTS